MNISLQIKQNLSSKLHYKEFTCWFWNLSSEILEQMFRFILFHSILLLFPFKPSWLVSMKEKDPLENERTLYHSIIPPETFPQFPIPCLYYPPFLTILHYILHKWINFSKWSTSATNLCIFGNPLFLEIIRDTFDRSKFISQFVIYLIIYFKITHVITSETSSNST